MQNPFSKKNLVGTMWPGVVSAGPSVLLGATLSPELFAVSPTLVLLGAGYNAFKGTQAAHVISGKRHRDSNARKREEEEARRRESDKYMQESLDSLDSDTLEWLALNVGQSAQFMENNPELALELKEKLFKDSRTQTIAGLRKPKLVKGLIDRCYDSGGYIVGSTGISPPNKGEDNCKCTQCRLRAYQKLLGVEYKVVNDDGTPLRYCEKDTEFKKAGSKSDPKALSSTSLATNTKRIKTKKRLLANEALDLMNRGMITVSEYRTIVEWIWHDKVVYIAEYTDGTKQVTNEDSSF